MKSPRVARRVLAWLVPPADRIVIVGDADEEFRDRVRAGGRRMAWLWYWRQVIALVPHALRLRLAPAAAQFPGDVQYALRLWRRTPAFATAAITTQTIGIAVATAVIAVAHAILVRPLPYADADALLQIAEGASGSLSYQDFIDLRRQSRSFTAVAGFSGGSRTLTLPGTSADRVPMVEVTDGFFELLGVQPSAGRTFISADARRGAPGVVMLSDPAWRNRFGGDPNVIGRTILLSGQPHEVIGVLPPGFQFPLRGLGELWLPLRPSVDQEQRGYWHWLDAIGRRRAGTTDAEVDADLDAVAAGYARRDTKWHAAASLRAHTLRDVIVGGVRPTIRALLAGVVLTVLATCATIATLLLSRTTARARELTVRAAVGAHRARLIRQLVTENLLLSIAGGASGVFAAHWLLRGLVAIVPPGQRAALPYFDRIGVDPIVAAIALTLTICTGLMFGVVPALRASREFSAAAAVATRLTAGPGDHRLRAGLSAAQLAIAFILLAGTSLLATSMYRLLHVSPGFDPDGIVTMRLNLPPSYREDAIRNFHRQLFERLEALPGVRAVAAVSQAPLTGRGDNGSLTVVERSPAPGDKGPIVGLRTVSHGYFSTIGVPIVRGRGFSEADGPKGPGVVLVNQWLADHLLGGADPIGQHITFEFAPGPWEIIGIVGNERVDTIDRPMMPVVYFSSNQDALSAFTLIVRSARPEGIAGAVRQVVTALDRDLPVFGVRTVGQIASESGAVFIRRAALSLLGTFAVAALLLAAMSLYGVLAQTVADRTREIGVRLALGATRRDIFGMVLRRGLTAAVAGFGLGALGAFALSRLLQSLLFGVSAGDTLTLLAAAGLLGAVALVACLIPARRAVRIDPAAALRSE